MGWYRNWNKITKVLCIILVSIMCCTRIILLVVVVGMDRILVWSKDFLLIVLIVTNQKRSKEHLWIITNRGSWTSMINNSQSYKKNRAETVKESWVDNQKMQKQRILAKTFTQMWPSYFGQNNNNKINA